MRRRGDADRISGGPAFAHAFGMPASPHASIPGMAHAGHWLFRARNALAPAALVAIVALTRREDFVVPAFADGWLDAAGLVTIAAGLGLRFWVMATSGVRRSGVRRRVVAPTLYADGVYGWTRNPLYLGNALVLIGLALVFDSRWLAFVGLPLAFGAIACIVAAEERVLAQTFGHRYLAYCRTVPRFVPRRMPSFDGTRLDWRRGLRKEHGPIFAAASATLVLLAIEHHDRVGAFGMRRAPALVATWLVAAAAWTAVRCLKRTGHLADATPTCLATNGLRHVG
jgi:protein-S-isoprenylcysteine O-methyltransferase Ste14